MFASLLGTLIDFTTCYRCLGLCSRNGDGPLSRHFEEDRLYQRLTEYNQAPYLHEICGYFWLTSNILCFYRLGQGDRARRAIRGCGPPCSLLPLLPRLHFLTTRSYQNGAGGISSIRTLSRGTSLEWSILSSGTWGERKGAAMIWDDI